MSRRHPRMTSRDCRTEPPISACHSWFVHILATGSTASKSDLVGHKHHYPSSKRNSVRFSEMETRIRKILWIAVSVQEWAIFGNCSSSHIPQHRFQKVKTKVTRCIGIEGSNFNRFRALAIEFYIAVACHIWRRLFELTGTMAIADESISIINLFDALSLFKWQFFGVEHLKYSLQTYQTFTLTEGNEKARTSSMVISDVW